MKNNTTLTQSRLRSKERSFVGAESWQFAFAGSALGWVLGASLAISLLAIPQPTRGGGVTIITHGLDGNTDGWITGMANAITNYPRYAGLGFTTYRIDVTPAAPPLVGPYTVSATRVSGTSPTNSDSGEIIVMLDWRRLATNSVSDTTYPVAAAIGPALARTDLIPELAGHALTEFPVHLIGHSRGGSLVCEISRVLGRIGIWVDQVTTLDPHPLKDDAFPLDWLNPQYLFRDPDAPANAYENVVFHDNYYQRVNAVVFGKQVDGAYIRELFNVDGGYTSGLWPAHSDVHLWYHGTIDLQATTTDSDAGSLTPAERSGWWTAYEASGANAGFVYSLIAGGNRLSTDQPLSFGNPTIKDGYNQDWDFGAGIGGNRVALGSNSGDWPNAIKFNRLQTNQVVQGQGASLRLYWQWAKPPTSTGTITFYLDDDLNPLNSSQTQVAQYSFQGNGAGNVSKSDVTLTLAASNATPGLHAIFAKITGGGRTRYLYAPEFIQVVRDPTTCTFTLTPASAGVPKAGGSYSFAVTAAAGCAWTATANRTWIHTTSAGMGNGTVTYTVDTNANSSSRSGSITVEGQTFTITQAGAYCFYSLGSSGLTGLSASGGTSNFTVSTTAGCPWTATAGDAWIHTSSAGVGSGTVSFTFDPNPSAYMRMGSVSVEGWPFAITQSGATCTATFSTNSVLHGPSATTYGFDLRTPQGCVWSASTSAAWVHLTGATFGTGPMTVKYRLDVNATTSARSAVILVAGQSFTLTQSPGWVPHKAFGLLWDAGDGWYGGTPYGWLWVHPGGQWIWSSTLQGWLAVTDPNARTLWSTQFRWLTPSAADPYKADTTALGAVYVGKYNGATIPDSWVVSERFGYVWANGDGKWFYSDNYGWLGVTPEGGIWCVSQGRFL